MVTATVHTTAQRPSRKRVSVRRPHQSLLEVERPRVEVTRPEVERQLPAPDVQERLAVVGEGLHVGPRLIPEGALNDITVSSGRQLHALEDKRRLRLAALVGRLQHALDARPYGGMEVVIRDDAAAIDGAQRYHQGVSNRLELAASCRRRREQGRRHALGSSQPDRRKVAHVRANAAAWRVLDGQHHTHAGVRSLYPPEAPVAADGDPRFRRARRMRILGVLDAPVARRGRARATATSRSGSRAGPRWRVRRSGCRYCSFCRLAARVPRAVLPADARAVAQSRVG